MKKKTLEKTQQKLQEKRCFVLSIPNNAWIVNIFPLGGWGGGGEGVL